MSEPLLASRELMTRPLGSMVSIDPESLPLGTIPSFEFHYFDISCVANGRLQMPDMSIAYAEAPSRARRIVKNGDVLMSTVRPNLKAFAYCNLPEGSYVASTGFAVLRAIEGNDPRYILYSILSDDVARQINSYVVGSNYPAINSSDVKRLQIPGWKPSQQRRIAEILSTVDRAIEQTEALIAKYQQIKTGLMHDLFTRGVTPDGHLRPTRAQAPHLYRESPLGWIPKEWECSPAEALLARIIDYRGKTPVKTVTGIPLITAKNVRMGYIDPEPREFIAERDYAYWMTRGIPNLGDVLFTTEAPLGNVAQIEATERVAFAQRVIILQPTPKIRSGFLKVVLMSERIQRAIARLSSGTTALGIKQSEFRKVLLSHPSDTKEQELIEVKLESVDGYIQGQQNVMGKLLQEKHGLMQDLLTGHVRMKVAEAEVTV
jgi:type I restriction enzyme, S subunit